MKIARALDEWIDGHEASLCQGAFRQGRTFSVGWFTDRVYRLAFHSVHVRIKDLGFRRTHHQLRMDLLWQEWQKRQGRP